MFVSVLGPLYMETDVFWNYLWVFAEHEISKLKVVAGAMCFDRHE